MLNNIRLTGNLHQKFVLAMAPAIAVLHVSIYHRSEEKVKRMTHAHVAEQTQLEQDVRQALKDWHSANHSASPLTYLYLWRKMQRAGYSAPRQATNQVLLEALAELKETHEADDQVLQMRFLDLLPIHQVANKLNVAESTVYYLQREAIRRLADTLRTQEDTASAAQKELLARRLPAATYVNLIGVETRLEQLIQTLVAPQPPWLVALEGIGGIGKTSLAHAAVQHLVQRGLLDEVGWVSAQATRFSLGGVIRAVEQPALRAEALIENILYQLAPEVALGAASSTERLLGLLQARLKATPHLIVIDNLETLTDVESLLPTLQKLANPTKFLLTSRERMYAELSLFHLQVDELSEFDALRLVRQEAELSNLPVLATSPEADLRPIVETVGGNPLALRLVIGQTHIHPLKTILGDLRSARTQTVDHLYTYIYWQAWESLDELSRRVLLTMPLAHPQGEELDYLADVGALDADDVRLALNKLVTLNLVDARGGLHDRRYSIHGLTRTFLQNQVAKWKR